MKRSWLYFLGAVVLVVVAAVIALLVIQPWNPSSLHYQKAAIAANGNECAAIGSISKLYFWLVGTMLCNRMHGSLDYGGGAVWLALTAMTVDMTPGAKALKYKHGVVASIGECATTGRSILEKGGTAVDAAIATLFCQGVSCAQCMGLSGGFLATMYDAKSGRVRVLNARERAPAATTLNMFQNASSTVGGLAVAVPGELRGYGAMYEEYGHLPWAELVKPTADLCRKGHHVNAYMGRVLQSYGASIKAEPSMSEVYVNPKTGDVYREGDTIKLLTLANTLDIIAEEGPEAIHNGSLTAKLVQDIQGFGGIITEEDLRNYKVEWQDPITAELDNEHTLYTNPLPGSGSVLVFIMNMLRGWVGTDALPTGSDLYWHRVVETFKYAYAKRTGLGDPNRKHSNLTYDIRELERNVSKPEFAEAFRALVNDTHTFDDWEHYGAFYQGADDHGTAHAVVVAPDGSAVSITSTINYIWGAQRRSRSLGIILNNEMDDFAIPHRISAYGLPAAPANFLGPGLNPLSSMVPSIVLNKAGQAVLVAGGAGGTKITTQVALLLRHTLLEGHDLESAMTRPRLHHQLLPMEIQYEEDFDKCILGILAIATVGALVAVLVLRPWEGQSSHQRYQEAAVGSNGHECAAIGRDILRRNGSAVDAAIAVLFCEGVSCAQCLGLSGGFLATIYDASTGRVSVLNARERAPAATREDMFTAKSARVGGLAVAVPGELRGYGEMYRKFGRLPWRELVKPSADLCRNGHYVTEYMARMLRSYSEDIKSDPSMREVYVNGETGEVWHQGNVIVLPALAATLDTIAEEGPEAMHSGSLTEQLVRDIREYGGIITADDLRKYRVEWKEPITAQLDDKHTLYTSPLPGSGAVLAFIMNMQKDWVGDQDSLPGSSLYWHRIIESFKYAYAKRTKLGDPTRSNVDYDINEVERNLSRPEFAQMYRALVNDSQTSNDWKHYGAEFEGACDHGTAHSVVVAPDGSAVSVTTTINYIWGCKRISKSLGIVLNNEMDDFAIPNITSGYGLPPSPANFLGPGLNPLSSMVPSIVLNSKGQVVLVVGGAGGTKITTQVALMIRHLILEESQLYEAMGRPRLHHQLLPMEVMFEDDFDPKILSSLRKLGHVVPNTPTVSGFCAMVAAIRDADGFLIAQYDKRRIGSVDGF